MASFPHSQLGFGCYGLAGVYGKKVDATQANALIRLAFDLGIRVFDTADSYGTEEILGQALGPLRNEVTIATKVGAASSLEKKQVLLSCETSLKNLGTDWIDLYQVHYDDPRVPPEDIIETLEVLKDQGKIRHYGIGHLPLDKTIAFLNLGSPLAVMAEMSPVVMARYRELRPLQRKHDFGIIAFSVTGRGLLTGSIGPAPLFSDSDIRRLDPLFKRSRLASGLRIKNKLAEIGRSIRATPTQIAIGWTLSRPGVITALTGPTLPEHLAENCGALKLKRDGDWLEEIDSFISREKEIAAAGVAEDLNAILKFPLADWDRGKGDLVYLLEHAVENELMAPSTAADFFRQVVSPRADLNSLEAIKTRIKTTIYHL